MKTISRDTYLKALALFVLASTRYREGNELEATLAALLGYPGGERYIGHLSDAISDGTGSLRSFADALQKEGFEVEPDQESTPTSAGGRETP